MYFPNLIKPFISIIFLANIVSCAAPTKQNSTPNIELEEVTTTPIETKTNKQLAFNHPQTLKPKQKPPLLIEKTIWEQIEIGFKLPAMDHPSIDQEFKRLLKHPYLLKQNINAALPLLSYAFTETQRRDLPSEIALIPFIESNYELTAKSSSNAKGLWQIIPSTAKSLGLQHSIWQDDSYNPVLSTEAALNYFTENNKRFNDWILSIAAYNGGPSRISRQVAAASSSNDPHIFFSLPLAPETKNYLPRLLAYKKLFMEHRSHPNIFSPNPNFKELTKVTISQQTSFSVLASIAEVDQQKMIKYNPGYTRWSTPPESPAVLLLSKYSARLLRNKEKHLSANQRLPWIEYKIKSGDTLSEIARSHEISVATLKILNSLKNDRILAGQILRIPLNQTDA